MPVTLLLLCIIGHRLSRGTLGFHSILVGEGAGSLP